MDNSSLSQALTESPSLTTLPPTSDSNLVEEKAMFRSFLNSIES